MAAQGGVDIMDKTPDSFEQLKQLVQSKILAREWYAIGIELGLTIPELEHIKQDSRQPSATECCKEMLSLWKEKSNDVTGEALINAIKDIGNITFAAQLREDNIKNEQGEDQIIRSDYLEARVIPNVATKWHFLGLYLGLLEDDLQQIRQQGSNPCASQCDQMFMKWLGKDPEDCKPELRPTWQNLYDALIAMKLMRTAEELKHDLSNL